MESYNKMYQNEASSGIPTANIWQMSTTPADQTAATAVEEETPVSFTENETATTTEEPDTMVYGRVVNCKKLNVREEPETDADIVCVIDALTDVVIDEEDSTDEFYKVYLSSGLEGFCMKKFIVIVES